MTSRADAETVFTEVFATYHRAVHAYLVGRLGEPQAARDLLQETFLRVWRRIGELGPLPPERRQAWIFTVARNLVTDTYRTEATRNATVRALGVQVQPIARPADQPDARAETGELVREVGSAVRSLPEELRVILTMHAVGELTSAQIGAALGLPAGTVRYKLAMARRSVTRTLTATALTTQEARDD